MALLLSYITPCLAGVSSYQLGGTLVPISPCHFRPAFLCYSFNLPGFCPTTLAGPTTKTHLASGPQLWSCPLGYWAPRSPSPPSSGFWAQAPCSALLWAMHLLCLEHAPAGLKTIACPWDTETSKPPL